MKKRRNIPEWGITTPPFGHPSFFQRRGVKLQKRGGCPAPQFFLFHNKKDNKINRII